MASTSPTQSTAPNKRCTVCGRTFSKREHLQRHFRCHTKERPFACTTCGKAFARSDILKRHTRSHGAQDGDGSVSGAAPSVISPTTPRHRSVAQQNQQRVTQMNPTIMVPEFTDNQWPGMDWMEATDADIPEDFNFASLDGFLNDLMTDWVQGTTHAQSHYDSTSLGPPTQAQQSRSRTPNTEQEAELLAEQCTVDEQYSNSISRQLEPAQQRFDTVLSADYLNLCLQLYFAHFHPIFPVIHAATFRPRAYNALLLTSMCSIGSLFIGSPEGTSQGQQLYSRLNKAILAVWETHISERRRRSLPMIQAALLGQTFGMLSKRSADRFMTEAFQGTLLAWARSVGAFDLVESHGPAETLTGTALTNAWITWARAEELRRLALALYIHDAEIACLFRREPYLRHQSITYYVATSDDIFSAATAEEWQRLYLDGHQRSRNWPPVRIADWIQQSGSVTTSNTLASSIENSSLAAYATLCNLGAHLVDRMHEQPLSSPEIERHGQSLDRWYLAYSNRIRAGSSDSLCLRVLYHYYSSLLYINLGCLERILDTPNAHADMAEVVSAAASSTVPWALLHTCLLQKHASELQMGAIPPIHLPRALLGAGLVFTAHFHYFLRLSNPPDGRRFNQDLVRRWQKQMSIMPGTEMLAQSEGQDPQQLASWASGILGQRGSTLPYACVDLLRKLNWGVAGVFADMLQAALRSSTEPV